MSRERKNVWNEWMKKETTKHTSEQQKVMTQGDFEIALKHLCSRDRYIRLQREKSQIQKNNLIIAGKYNREKKWEHNMQKPPLIHNKCSKSSCCSMFNMTLNTENKVPNSTKNRRNHNRTVIKK